MDMEEDVDDPMEIDDTLPAAPIIERKSDEFSPPAPSHLEPLAQSVLHKPPASEIVENIVKEPQKSQSDDSDVVILDDDDEPFKGQSTSTTSFDLTSSNDHPVKDIIDLVEKPHNSRCLNSVCEGTNTEFILAPDFCLSYFRVKRSKSYKEEICKDCFSKSVEDFDKLSTELKNGNLILGVSYPIINETLQIEDSDEEDEEKEEKMEYIDKENFDFISENIDDILQETLEKVNFGNCYELETIHVKKESRKVEEDYNDLSKKVKEIRNILDGIQLNLYNQFRPDFRSLRGITILDDLSLAPNTVIRVDTSTDSSPRKSTRSHKPVSYVELDDLGNSNSPKVNTPNDKSPDVEPPKDLPPILPIDRPPPQVGENYYIVRENSQGSWIRARLQLIIPPGTPHSGMTYNINYFRLVELKQQKERLLNGRSIAYLSFSRVRLPVGTRVISVFKETSNMGETKKPRHDPYYAGIVAEQPFEGNRFRYLIFFDIGYSQYVSYHCVNLVLESSTNVWEDVYVESRPFIKKYLESQDRPMVKLAKDQTVRVEYNGKWWLCTVMNVDCSLVQVFFDSLSRTEWIYRGSTRLSPMYREEQAATNRHTGLRTSRKLGHNESATVVQYTRNNDFVLSSQESPTNNVRAVARKSTTRPQANLPIPNIVPFLPQVNSTPSNITGPTSKIMYFTPRDQVIIKRTYRPHTCSSDCKEYLTHNFSQLRGHNPLSKPLLCGWGRMTLKAKGRKEIIYKAPCGRLLRNIAEVHYYLRLTSSEMTVDLFDFNHMVRCLAEFSVECNPDPKDLSRGLEQVPIPVINGINNEMLDFCNYSIKRVPMEGVHMNLETEFLCGCDCDDDCIDKTKCACWKLTLEGAKYTGKDVDPNSVGYIYRRLPEQVITGIYECNSRCKCNSTCLNRVVQNPMSLKLQVFKTHNRGWGIRCLNDVPQGSFICIYAGTLHTEAMANEDGMAYGDEYFAELDYIETVEKFKEDYEAEVLEEEEESRYRGKSPQEEEDEEQTIPMKQTGAKSKRYNYSEDNDFTPAHPVPTRVREADTSISKKQQWNVEATTNLILLYENHPCLYRVKSKEYHNRNSRNKAYSDITHNLNTCHPDMAFNEAIVKNKIHTLRTQYTSEMNKIKKSEASGVSPDDVHKPTLWCFDLLRFLEDSEVIIQGESNLELESQHEIVAESEVESEIIFDGTIEDITNPFSPPESHDGEQSKKRPSSSVSQTPKRSCLSNLEEPLLYKKRDTPALNKRKQEDSQLSKLLDNATKAISSISEKSEDSNQYADIDLFARTRLRKRNNDDEAKTPTTPTENKPEPELKIKKEFIEPKIDLKSALEKLGDNIETVTISDEEDEGREVLSFNPKTTGLDDKAPTYTSVRDLFGDDECVYVMDAKNAGNIGRFLNHSCSPNVFVQNVFVDTHDPRFPWVSFFSSQFIRAGTELTWNYNYDIGSVPGRVLYCHCASLECKGRLL